MQLSLSSEMTLPSEMTLAVQHEIPGVNPAEEKNAAYPPEGEVFPPEACRRGTSGFRGFLNEILYRLKIYKEVKKWQRLN